MVLAIQRITCVLIATLVKPIGIRKPSRVVSKGVLFVDDNCSDSGLAVRQERVFEHIVRYEQQAYRQGSKANHGLHFGKPGKLALLFHRRQLDELGEI